MEKTWQIRDQLPNGAWSEPRTVTLVQYKAEIACKAAEARAIHRANVATVERESRQ